MSPEKDRTFDPISRAASVPAIAAVAKRKLKNSAFDLENPA
jgi:hypothetical protein